MFGASSERKNGGNMRRPHISIGTEQVEADEPKDFKAPELFPPLRATNMETEEDSEDDNLILFEKSLAKRFQTAASFLSKDELTGSWPYLNTIENHEYFPPSLIPKKKNSTEKPLTDKQWMEKLKSEITNHNYLSLKEVVSAKKSKVDNILCPPNKKKIKVENNSTASQYINESVVKELEEEDEEDIDVDDCAEPIKKEEEIKEDEPKDSEEELASDVDDELDNDTDYNKNYFDNGEENDNNEDDDLDDELIY